MASAKANFEVAHPDEFKKMITDFREIMKKKCQPLPDEPDYFTCDLM